MIEQNSILCNTSDQQSGMSLADKVISNLTSLEDLMFQLCIWLPKLSLARNWSLRTLSLQKKTPKPQWELHITFKSNVVNNGGETLKWPATFTELMAASKDDGSTADSPEHTARAIYNSLGIEDNTEILLLIGWCTNKQRRLLALFPKSLACNVIFKTNIEKRPVFHICGKTSSNETFTGIYAMLPSQAVWVFDLVWSVVIRCLADPQVLVHSEQITTDGDNKIYNPFVALIYNKYIIRRYTTSFGKNIAWSPAPADQ
jgi:hypothetical protein